MGWGKWVATALGGPIGYAIHDKATGGGNTRDSWLWGDKKVGLDRGDTQLQGGDYIRDISQQNISSLMGRQAPQADRTMVGQVARADEGRADQFRQQQIGLMTRLSQIASGQQAGAGELAARRMGDRGMAQQMAMGASARGGNAAMAARSAARNAADISQATAGQAQQAALQDQQAANAALANVAGQGRQQDLSVALANMGAENQRIFQQAGLDQATSLANMQARLQMMGMNDQAILGFLSQLYGVDAAEMQARLEQDRLAVAQRRPGMAGDLLAAAGTIGAAYAGKPG